MIAFKVCIFTSTKKCKHHDEISPFTSDTFGYLHILITSFVYTKQDDGASEEDEKVIDFLLQKKQMGVTWSPVNESVNYEEGRGEGVLI